MAALGILDSDACPQAASPLFTMIPLDLRLMIYEFVFVGCRATVWCDRLMNIVDSFETREEKRRNMSLVPGQCCFEHFEGGFGLLTTCRVVYIEAFQAYWSGIALTVGKLRCRDLHKVYTCLPPMIKSSVRHLRNVNLPLRCRFPPNCDDPNWTPTFLANFPKLVSCEYAGIGFSDEPILEPWEEKTFSLTVLDPEELARPGERVGRFQLDDGESPSAYLERMIGVQRSCGVIILHKRRKRHFPGRARYYYNWTTGRIYKPETNSNTPREFEDAYQRLISAKEGSSGLQPGTPATGW